MDKVDGKGVANHTLKKAEFDSKSNGIESAVLSMVSSTANYVTRKIGRIGQ